MAQARLADEEANPIDISLLGSYAVVLLTNGGANLVQETWRMRRRVFCRHDASEYLRCL